MRTYDKIWSSFLSIAKIDSRDIPTSDEAIYDTIQSAIRKFNIKIDDDLIGDDESETVNRELSGSELQLLAHCIRLIILENQLIYFSATFSPFTKEIGARNLGNQMNRLENLVERENETIDSIILKMTDDFL